MSIHLGAHTSITTLPNSTPSVRPSYFFLCLTFPPPPPPPPPPSSSSCMYMVLMYGHKCFPCFYFLYSSFFAPPPTFQAVFMNGSWCFWLTTCKLCPCYLIACSASALNQLMWSPLTILVQNILEVMDSPNRSTVVLASLPSKLLPPNMATSVSPGLRLTAVAL